MIISVVGKEFPVEVIPMIDAAKKSIEIVVFDWRWYPNDPGSAAQLFNQAILRAAKRGVEVKAVTNFTEICTVLAKSGVIAKKLSEKKLVHVKLMIIDGVYCILGSHNYTQNAFSMNYEVSVIFDDLFVIQRMREFFCNLFFK